MLTKFTEIIECYLASPMATIANQRHLRAIRDGIIATLPLIIVGSFFLDHCFSALTAQLGIYQFLSEGMQQLILLPYRMTMYIMSLYATFGIGASLAKTYKLDVCFWWVTRSRLLFVDLYPVNIPLEAGRLLVLLVLFCLWPILAVVGCLSGIITSILQSKCIV